MAVPLDVAIVADLDGARGAHTPEVVATEVDEHQVLGVLLLVLGEFLAEELVFFFGGSAPAGPGDRVRRGHPVGHGHERLGTRSDDRERGARRAAVVGTHTRHAQQVHVRTRVGGPQNAIDVERIGVGVDLEAHRRHHLECLTRLDFADQAGDDLAVLLAGALHAEVGCGPVEARHGRRCRCSQRLRHRVESGDGVDVCLLGAFGTAVPIHRVRDEGDAPLVMVYGGKVCRQQHHQIGKAEVVDCRLG